MSQFLKTLKNKSKEILIINLCVFVPMWAVFLVNHYLLANSLNIWGIHPREVSIAGAVSLFTSWLLHANFLHITGNSTVLLPLLLMVCLLEKNPARHLLALIFVSGLFTWILGLPNSVHIGASGLVFALFGYILASLFIGKNYFYLIPVAVLAYFYSQSILLGLIPKEGISFAGHFGGFVGGFIVGSFIHKRAKTRL